MGARHQGFLKAFKPSISENKKASIKLAVIIIFIRL